MKNVLQAANAANAHTAGVAYFINQKGKLRVLLCLLAFVVFAPNAMSLPGEGYFTCEGVEIWHYLYRDGDGFRHHLLITLL